MSNGDSATIVRLTEEACAALPQLGSRKAILVVFNRIRSQWWLLIGEPASTVDQLTDDDEAVQLNVDSQTNRAAVQAEVEKSVQHLAHVIATTKL